MENLVVDSLGEVSDLLLEGFDSRRELLRLHVSVPASDLLDGDLPHDILCFYSPVELLDAVRGASGAHVVPLELEALIVAFFLHLTAKGGLLLLRSSGKNSVTDVDLSCDLGLVNTIVDEVEEALLLHGLAQDLGKCLAGLRTVVES